MGSFAALFPWGVWLLCLYRLCFKKMQFISLFEVQNQLCNISTHALYADLGLSWSVWFLRFCCIFSNRLHKYGVYRLISTCVLAVWITLPSLILLQVIISWPHLAITVAMVTLRETNSKITWKWMVGIRAFPFGMACFSGAFAVSFREGTYLATVDGRNPAPVDMVNIPLFTGFHTCWVVAWDFWTINSTVLNLPSGKLT